MIDLYLNKADTAPQYVDYPQGINLVSIQLMSCNNIHIVQKIMKL